MIYSVRWNDSAEEDLAEIGFAESKRIAHKVNHYLVKDPENLGKPLRSGLSGFYSYRIGDYRVIYRLEKRVLIIEIVRVGHRREVYEE